MFNKNDFRFADKIDDLISEFENSSDPQQKKMATYAKQMRRSHKEIANALTHFQESMDYLRVCIKYLLFDLEATKREKDRLRNLLLEQEDEDYDSN